MLQLTLNAQKWQQGLTWGRQNCHAVLGADCSLVRSASVDFKCPDMAARPYLRETKLPGSTRSWLFAAEKFFSWFSLPSAGGSNVSWFRSKFKLTSPCHYIIIFNSTASWWGKKRSLNSFKQFKPKALLKYLIGYWGKPWTRKVLRSRLLSRLELPISVKKSSRIVYLCNMFYLHDISSQITVSDKVIQILLSVLSNSQ